MQFPFKHSITLIIILALFSCSQTKLIDNYYIDTDPENGNKTLYLNNEDLYIERVRNVKQVGLTSKYVIVQCINKSYYIIDIQKDNYSKKTNEISIKIKSENDLRNWLKTQNINNFEFIYKY